MNELEAYRAVSEARAMIRSGVHWRVAVKNAAAKHNADPASTAWLTCAAIAGQRAAQQALQDEPRGRGRPPKTLGDIHVQRRTAGKLCNPLKGAMDNN